MTNLSSISWQDYTIVTSDDSVCFVLDQYTILTVLVQ